MNCRATDRITPVESDLFLMESADIPEYFRGYVVEICCFDNMEYCKYDTPVTSKYMAAVYNHRRMAFFPASLYDDILNDRDAINDIGLQSEDRYPFYLVPVPDGVDAANADVVFVLTPVDYNRLPFYIRPFAPRLDRYAATEIAANRKMCTTVEIGGRQWLLVGRHDYIDCRVEDIVLRAKGQLSEAMPPK